MTKITDETKIALIENNVSFIKEGMKDIQQSIKELSGVFATKEELIQVEKEIKLRLTNIESNVQSLMGPKKMINQVVTALFTAALTVLVLSFLGKLRGI